MSISFPFFYSALLTLPICSTLPFKLIAATKKKEKLVTRGGLLFAANSLNQVATLSQFSPLAAVFLLISKWPSKLKNGLRCIRRYSREKSSDRDELAQTKI